MVTVGVTTAGIGEKGRQVSPRHGDRVHTCKYLPSMNGGEQQINVHAPRVPESGPARIAARSGSRNLTRVPESAQAELLQQL